jgi:hypothetical protein
VGKYDARQILCTHNTANRDACTTSSEDATNQIKISAEMSTEHLCESSCETECLPGLNPALENYETQNQPKPRHHDQFETSGLQTGVWPCLEDQSPDLFLWPLTL